MSKITHSFTIPEETEEYAIYNQAYDNYAILHDLYSDIRSWRKHGHKFKTPDEVIDQIVEIYLQDFKI